MSKYKCKFCGREMKITALAYMSNQYCNNCFYERADSTQKTNLNTFEFMGDKINLNKNIKTQTAIDWLIEQLTPSIKLQQKYINELKEEAKAMEREQAIKFTNDYLEDNSNIKIHISQLVMEIELNTDSLSPLRHSSSFLKLKKFTNDEFHEKYDIAEEFKNLFDIDET